MSFGPRHRHPGPLVLLATSIEIAPSQIQPTDFDCEGPDPPPLKWSDSKHGLLPEEDCNAKEETQA
jgi:hypothetical protein